MHLLLSQTPLSTYLPSLVHLPSSFFCLFPSLSPSHQSCYMRTEHLLPLTSHSVTLFPTSSEHVLFNRLVSWVFKTFWRCATLFLLFSRSFTSHSPVSSFISRCMTVFAAFSDHALPLISLFVVVATWNLYTWILHHLVRPISFCLTLYVAFSKHVLLPINLVIWI